jgi:DNA-nicking Smr family endonuclease
MRVARSDERQLWREAMRGVKPLRHHANNHQVLAELPLPSSEPVPILPPPPRQAAPAHQAPGTGLDRRTAQRLKRGQMAIEGRLDLHGMTQDRAHDALRHFIASGDAAGKRLLIVVTGKSGVLHHAVPRWLAEGENRGRVLSIAAAQSKDGGAGALYVLLRRRR